MPFDTNVFINCPFDSEYRPTLKALVFTLVWLDFEPKISETNSSSTSRIERLLKMIEQSRYSIHDLSRMQSKRPKELARFNMPFELGLDFACKRFGAEPCSHKHFLILDTDRYRYQKSISDLAGYDIKFHENSPANAVLAVRNWMYAMTKKKFDSGNKIWRLYNEFMGDFREVAIQDELHPRDLEEMPWEEFAQYVRDWRKGKKTLG